MICDRCRRPLATGEHGQYKCPLEPQSLVHGVIGDDIPGGFVQTNFGHEPEIFYSKKAMLKRADALGLRPFERNAGPHDKHVPRWASVDLEAATALVSRMGESSKDDEVVCETAKITVDVL